MTKNLYFLVAINILFLNCTEIKKEYIIVENEDTLYNCRDKKDNDLDQLIDCEDPDCSLEVYCVERDAGQDNNIQEDIIISDTFVRDSNISDAGQDNNIQEDIIISDIYVEDTYVEDVPQNECTYLGTDCPIKTYCNWDDQEAIYKCIPGCNRDEDCGPHSTCGLTQVHQCCTDNDRYYLEEGCGSSHIDVDDNNLNCTTNSIDNDGDSYCQGKDCNDNNSYCNTNCDDTDNDGIQDCNICPESIHEVGNYNISKISGIQRVDNLLYTVAADGFRIIDVSDPTSPRELGLYSGVFSGMYLYGSYQFLYNSYNTIEVHTDSSYNIELVQTYSGGGGPTISIINNNYLMYNLGSRTIDVLNCSLSTKISSIVAPSAIKNWQIERYTPGIVFGTTAKAVDAWDISGIPSQVPEIKSSLSIPSGIYDAYIANNMTLYVTTGKIFQMYYWTDLSRPPVLQMSYEFTASAGSFSIREPEEGWGAAVILQGSIALLKIYTDTTIHIEWLGETYMSGSSDHVSYNPPYIYTSQYSTGVKIYSVLCQD
jgi:hypothetical protein